MTLTASSSLAHFCVELQILIGEFIFCFPYERRKNFWLRFLISFCACLFLSAVFPTVSLPVANLYRTIQLIIFFGASIAVYAVSFRMSFKVVLSLCSAGYALQHIGYQTSVIFHNLSFGDAYDTLFADHHRIMEMLIIFAVYGIFILIFGKKLWSIKIDQNYNKLLSGSSVFVIMICIVLSLFSGSSDKPVEVALYAIICCSLALVVQFSVSEITELNRENEKIRQKTEADLARYESSKEALEFISIKCHDLKKELNALEGIADRDKIEELKKSIEIYDSVPNTGSDIVDTVLITNMLRETQYGIRFTFMGNGGWFSFMDSADLKSLFMNAVSNAAEAAEQVSEDRRGITIAVDKRGEMVILTVSNYYVGAPIGRCSGEGITSTKQAPSGEHGFGLKSMRAVARKYGGSLSVEGTGEIFTLTVFMIDKQ